MRTLSRVSERVRVRKVGRRSIAAGRFLPTAASDQSLGLHVIGMAAFFPLMLLLLAYQKAACHFGVWPTRALAAALAVPLLALIVAGLRTKELASMDHEELLEPEDVERQLASFELSVNDLIFEEGWKAVSESARFAEAAGVQADVLASRARRWLAVKIGVGLAVALVLVVAWATAGDWLFWLMRDDC